MTATKLSRIALLLLIVGGAVGCRKQRNKDEPSGAVPAGSSSAAVVIAAKGDTGIVEGYVTMEGDPAAIQPNLLTRIPKDCTEALKVYELIFREGPARRVADVFVGVTGYQGTPGEKRGPVSVVANGCAWNKRTFGLTTQQHLSVRSTDNHPYVPALYGTKVGAALVAVPGGDAVPVYTKGPGMYLLVDEMRNFTQATVLVVKFPTFDVTGLDGKFRIEGVPVGSADISAYLPTVNLKAEQKITVTKNSTTRVNLTLR
ncbi:MAG TPA: hypothetical protein VIV60_28875, partial [Polyangiaceae bacterium]